MIPAPLLDRQVAVAVVAATVVAVAVSIASVLIPIDDASPWGLALVRFLGLALQALVLVLAVFLLARTRAPRTRRAATGWLLGSGGFVLLAVVEVLGILGWTEWGSPPVMIGLGVAGGAAFAALGAGLVVLSTVVEVGRAVLRVAGIAVVPLGALLIVDDFLPSFVVAVVYSAWSLVFLGLAAALRAPRHPHNGGFPAALPRPSEV